MLLHFRAHVMHVIGLGSPGSGRVPDPAQSRM